MMSDFFLFKCNLTIAFLIVCYVSKSQLTEIDLSSTHNGQVIMISPNSSTLIEGIYFSSDVTSIIFEAHSQTNNVTLSYLEKPTVHTSVTGRNVGLTYVLELNASKSQMWLISNNEHNISVFIKLVSHTAYEPVPGGCNMEFPVEIAPYLRVTDDQFSTCLEFQHANMGSPRTLTPPSCDKSAHFLSYDVYVWFLDEHNYSEIEYFSGISHMSNISFLNKNVRKVNLRVHPPRTRIRFFKYPKTGFIYNIVAKYISNGVTTQAAYVPSATYGCNVTSEDFSCGLPYTSITTLFLINLSIFGLIVAFCGHKCFTMEVFFIGFLVSLLISFIILSKYNGLWSEKNTFVFSLLLGLSGGIMWMIVWLVFFRPVISVFLVGLALGFLLTATLLHTPLGNYELFTNGKIYWVFLCGVTTMIAGIFLIHPKAMSITGSSVIGSYLAVLPLDHYLGSSLVFIIVNIVKRALANDTIFAAVNTFPFQSSDILVTLLWVVITIFSLIIQIYMNLEEADFPKPHCICWKIRYPGCNCSTGIQEQATDSHFSDNLTEPLLSQSHQNHVYSSVNE